MAPESFVFSWIMKPNRQISTYINHWIHKTKKIYDKFISKSHLYLKKDRRERDGQKRGERRRKRRRLWEGSRRWKINHQGARVGLRLRNGSHWGGRHLSPRWPQVGRGRCGLSQHGTKDGWWCENNQPENNANYVPGILNVVTTLILPTTLGGETHFPMRKFRYKKAK